MTTNYLVCNIEVRISEKKTKRILSFRAPKNYLLAEGCLAPG